LKNLEKVLLNLESSGIVNHLRLLYLERFKLRSIGIKHTGVRDWMKNEDLTGANNEIYRRKLRNIVSNWVSFIQETFDFGTKKAKYDPVSVSGNMMSLFILISCLHCTSMLWFLLEIVCQLYILQYLILPMSFVCNRVEYLLQNVFNRLHLINWFLGCTSELITKAKKVCNFSV